MARRNAPPASPPSGPATLESELIEARDQLAAVDVLLQVIGNGRFDPQDLFDALIEQAVRLCHAESGIVSRLIGDQYVVVSAYGASRELAAATLGHAFSPGRGYVQGRAALELRSVQVADVLADPELSTKPVEDQRIGGFRTVLAVPMIHAGTAIGVISLRRNHVEPFETRYVELLETFARQAVIAAENARLFEATERQRQELTRFISPQIASLLTSDEGQQLLQGHRRAITVLFCDLRGFSPFSETAEPEEVLDVLREYHAAMGELIVAHGGTLEHFAGDGMMVFFNDPLPIPDHELQAMRLAVAMRSRFEGLALAWQRKGYDLGFGIGAAVGHATLGRIGFEGRYDYGAVGNVVIVASRLSGEAKAGQILMTRRLHAAVEEHVTAEAIGELTLKGQTRPVSAFNLTALRSAKPALPSDSAGP